MTSYIPAFGDESASSATAFSPGLNEGVALTQFDYVRENDNEYVQLSFEKEGSLVNDRVYIPKDPRPKKKRDGSMETIDEAMIRAWGDVNTKLKHVVTNYADTATFDTRFQAAAPKTFEQFVSFCKTQIPPNVAQLRGELIVGYNGKGYLQIPFAMWVTGAFFSVNKVKGELSVSNRIVMVRPNDEAKEEEAAAPGVPVSWAAPQA